MSRLTQRVERLEESRHGKGRIVSLYVGEGETCEDVKARHLAEHPEDRNTGIFQFVVYHDPTKTQD